MDRMNKSMDENYMISTFEKILSDKLKGPSCEVPKTYEVPSDDITSREA